MLGCAYFSIDKPPGSLRNQSKSPETSLRGSGSFDPIGIQRKGWLEEEQIGIKVKLLRGCQREKGDSSVIPSNFYPKKIKIERKN
jgi:hypothetical protein